MGVIVRYGDGGVTAFRMARGFPIRWLSPSGRRQWRMFWPKDM